MLKRPKAPEAVFVEFREDLLSLFGTEIQAIYLYGSGARGQYDKKRSDINFLVLLSEAGLTTLERVAPRLRHWFKQGVTMPLFLSLEYIHSSLDSFPIEFLNIKLSYVTVFGPDFLKDLKISPAALRLKCEEQVKSKLLHLREGVLRHWPKKRALAHFLRLTVPTFLSLFRVLILLQNQDVPNTDVQVAEKTADLYHLDAEIFSQLLGLRNKSVKLDRPGLQNLSRSLIGQMQQLAKTVDKWQE